MLTPQDIQEIAFDKAMFGGYDMQSVDEFLEPLTQDYLTLYKENAVLKSKMRLLVDKLEEYRRNEDSMKNAMVAAQKTCDEMIAKAEKQCAAMLTEAEANAKSKSKDIDSAILNEKERLNRAKAATKDFIETVEADIQRQLAALGNLKLMDLKTEPVLRPEEPRKAYDYEQEKDAPAPKDTPDDIADEIEQSVEKIMGDMEARPATPMSATRIMPALDKNRDKFADLQFGRNYDPTNP